MLYAINSGGVQGYTDGQKWVLHLVCYIEDIVAAGIPYVFADGHAEMAFSAQYADLGDLAKVDWDLMRSSYWNDTNEYPDRKRRRQAEFLVHGQCPWSLVREIGVLNSEVSLAIQPYLKTPEQPEVTVRPGWYY